MLSNADGVATPPIYPAAFGAYRQFVLYKQVPQPDGKIKKIPISPITLQAFDSSTNWQDDPAQWTDGPNATALAQMLGHPYGVGFLFTEQDPFFFVDIDGALIDGAWSESSQELLRLFAGCAVEVSVSNTGLHIFGTGEWPTERRCDAVDKSFSLFTERRFVALTGTHLQGDAATVADPAVIARLTAEKLTAVPAAQAIGWTTEPVEGYSHLEDDELLAKAKRSGGAGAVFGGRATFGDLWEPHERILAKAYPPDANSSDPFGRSEADAALAQHLAFWTGRNCERVRRLMQRSGLKRDKWEREDYLIRTIQGACDRQVEVYKGPDKRREEQLAANIAIGEDVPGDPTADLMGLEEMLSTLVFIGDQHAIGHRKAKRVRRKTAAADEYAASRHTFVDPDTRQEKSTPAFKAWISHPKRLTVDGVTWRPGYPDLCRPAEGHGLAFNTWRGLQPMEAPNDWRTRVQPWVDHVGWLCMRPEIAADFMRWLAHIVQRPAQLPHTCYLHVTPTTGIGRNWMGGVLCRVLRGYVAAGVDLGKILDGKFNGRLSEKLLAIVDEVREGGNRNEQVVRAEKLKSTITEEHRHIDHKFGVQCVEQNCARWLMFSQHLDALPFENNDRRVVVVNNPTERQSGEYYERLYALWHDELFIASVREYLATLDLSGYSPSAPAPMTDAKRLALEVMASEVDYAVQEFARTWPADVAARSQILGYVGSNVSDGHLHHALLRAGLSTLPTRVRLNTGVRSRVVVLRGDRMAWGLVPANELAGICMEAEVRFKLD